MHIKTLLNHVTKFKSFVFQDPRLCRDSNKLFIHVEPRRNSKPLCSQCGYPGAVYDHLNQREFLLPPIWNIVVILLYTMRRVNCEHCGKVIVERVPWATGKSPVTKQFAAFSNKSVFLGHSAILVNEGLPNFIVQRLKDKYGLNDKTV